MKDEISKFLNLKKVMAKRNERINSNVYVILD
jgi:hypothetical protein